MIGFTIPNVRLGAEIDIVQQTSKGRNVIGRLPAATPEGHKRPALIIGAHIDHLGNKPNSSSRALGKEQYEAHHGADDNASRSRRIAGARPFPVRRRHQGIDQTGAGCALRRLVRGRIGLVRLLPLRSRDGQIHQGGCGRQTRRGDLRQSQYGYDPPAARIPSSCRESGPARSGPGRSNNATLPSACR